MNHLEFTSAAAAQVPPFEDQCSFVSSSSWISHSHQLPRPASGVERKENIYKYQLDDTAAFVGWKICMDTIIMYGYKDIMTDNKIPKKVPFTLIIIVFTYFLSALICLTQALDS